MKQRLLNKKYSGFIWHILFARVFIGLSLFFISILQGVAWFLTSAVLRIIFGCLILFLCTRLFEKDASEILSFQNTKKALFAGAGFICFFLYYLIVVGSGFGKTTGLSLGILLSRVLLQQATTGFYEEMNYRYLLLEGLKYTEDSRGIRIAYVFVSTVLFGLLHCVTGWNTYTFLQTGAIGFAFAVIFVKSGNIIIPMILHFLYDIIANMTNYIEWNHNMIFDNLTAIFEIMLAAMFVVSFVILIRKDT